MGLTNKVEFVKLSRTELLDSIHEQWKSFIQKILRVLTLVNGWFMFHFLLEEDRKVVEEWLWVFGKGSLVLSQWNVHFDPRMSTLAKWHLQMIFPGLPLFCWNIKAFTVAANSTGKFIHIEDSHLLESDKIFLEVLVEMDMEYCLFKVLQVV